jgi:hypothetical protein
MCTLTPLTVALDPIVHGETPHGMAAQPGGAVAAGGVLGRVTRWVVSPGSALPRRQSASATHKGGIENLSLISGWSIVLGRVLRTRRPGRHRLLSGDAGRLFADRHHGCGV